MKILLCGINYSPELTGVGKYNGEFMRWLAQHGHETRVITAPPYYPDWRVAPEYSAWKYQRVVEDGVSITRCPLYVPSHPSMLKRILHLMSYSLTSLPVLFLNLRWRPDLVIQVVPTIFCAPSSLLFSKLARSQCVLHIQDYEVDAMFGLSMTDGSVIRKIAYGLERRILNRFDWVSTISRGMMQRALDKGVRSQRLVLFPNWSDVGRFRNAGKDARFLETLGVDKQKKLILYSGSMGEKQGLEIAIEAASRLQNRTDAQFLFVGDGSAKSRLLAQCKKAQLTNVLFAPLQPHDLLPTLLASADCHLIVQKRGAADSVLPSKLTNILAVGGNAVITADADTSLGELARDLPGIAVRVEPESVSALLEGIERALSMPAPNRIAIDYAGRHFDRDRVLGDFMAHFTARAPRRPAEA